MARIDPSRYDAGAEEGSRAMRGDVFAADVANLDGTLLNRLARHLHVGAEVFFLPFEKLSRHAKAIATAKPAGLAEVVERIGDEEVRDRMLQLLHRMRRDTSEAPSFPAVDRSRCVSIPSLD